jgi:hypothetical protein
MANGGVNVTVRVFAEKIPNCWAVRIFKGGIFVSVKLLKLCGAG